ncbi:MAG: asparagine synthase (glutamine-hydrolyzing) [Bacteroidia bacterium]|nr:asparagine synthase (glutamine-hydrolyzing) [Bacteroidia bacterium]
MCGISGIVNFNEQNVEENSIRKMMALMKHRGPDDEGVFLDKCFGFGFVRLSIIDLSSAGHQPMQSSDGRYVLVFNGEIYNYIELREELRSLGVAFNTQTDSEVLLNAYIYWGEECLHKFNGMWAFAIYDKQSKNLFAARDRFGVKPFYYLQTKNQFAFCSEIPPLLSLLDKKPQANKQSIFDYLVFNRTDQTEDTFFEEVKKLQHGHKISIKNNKTTISRWYDLKKEVSKREGFKSSEEFREFFSSSVNLRLRSDVPVGVCLSGGLDSSSIVSVILNENKNKELNTFSAVYNKGQIGDESEYINEFKPIVKNMFFTMPESEDLQKDVFDFVKVQAEPIPSTSAYAEYKVMELAKGKIGVLLSGQGADESLAGYHYFFGFYFKDLLMHGKLITLCSEVISYLKTHRSLFGIKTFVYFMLPKKFRTSTRVSEKEFLNPEFIRQYQKNNSIAGNLYGSGSLKEALLDHFEYKLEHLLKWDDRNSMFFSLESRAPFLDYRLVEKTLASKSSLVIKKGMTKFILRDAMKGVLPEKIRVRKDKMGFGTPEDEWFRKDSWKKIIEEILKSDSFKNRNIIDPVVARKLFQDHLERKTNISKDIWKWVHLELWFREFIDPKVAEKEGKNETQVCKLGVWDKTVPGITFDEAGISNYAKLFQTLTSAYPRGDKGKEDWARMVQLIKDGGKNKRYDCIIGVSGGTDSSYLLHLAKQYNLRPLAVYLDNGWGSEIAVSNIQKLTTKLDIDLRTHVINYEEVKDLLKSYMYSGLPWIDMPTDLAIKSILYKMAAKEGIKYVLRGNDFRTEGSQPKEWTYGDGKQLTAIHKKFGKVKLKTFPNYTFFNLVYYGFFKKIKSIYPYYYLDYNKTNAQDFLIKNYNWEYYGGHHHENLFTKFAISYWLPVKFGIDKRKITYSALTLSGEMTREDALNKLNESPFKKEELERTLEYVLKKLDITPKEFEKIMVAKNHNYKDYPSYDFLFSRMLSFSKPFLKFLFLHKPQSIFQAEMRNKK